MIASISISRFDPSVKAKHISSTISSKPISYLRRVYYTCCTKDFYLAECIIYIYVENRLCRYTTWMPFTYRDRNPLGHNIGFQALSIFWSIVQQGFSSAPYLLRSSSRLASILSTITIPPFENTCDRKFDSSLPLRKKTNKIAKILMKTYEELLRTISFSLVFISISTLSLVFFHTGQSASSTEDLEDQITAVRRLQKYYSFSIRLFFNLNKRRTTKEYKRIKVFENKSSGSFLFCWYSFYPHWSDIMRFAMHKLIYLLISLCKALTSWVSPLAVINHLTRVWC